MSVESNIERPWIFISRAGEDKAAALLVDSALQELGFRTFIQDKDFGNTSFLAKMDDGFGKVDAGARLIAIVSNAYLSKAYCIKEAEYPLLDDAHNRKERLVLLRIDDSQPSGLLRDIPYIDIGDVLHAQNELAEILCQALVAKCAGRTPATLQARDPKIERLIEYLKVQDVPPHENIINWSVAVGAALAGLIIAFDFGLDAWNRFFGTVFFPLVDTWEAIFLFVILVTIIFYASRFQIDEWAREIEYARPSLSQIKALKQRAQAEQWKSKAMILSAISRAANRITARNIAT